MTGRINVAVELQSVCARDLVSLLQRLHRTTEPVKDGNTDQHGRRKLVSDGRDGIEWVRIVLFQHNFPSHGYRHGRSQKAAGIRCVKDVIHPTAVVAPKQVQARFRRAASEGA